MNWKKWEEIATKCDNAEVHEEVWMRHIIMDYPWKRSDRSITTWDKEESLKLPMLLFSIRKILLNYWKQNLGKEFESYLQNNTMQLHTPFGDCINVEVWSTQNPHASRKVNA